MSDRSGDAALNFFLIFIAGLAGLAGVFYIASYLMPYVLFFVLPFLLASASVGFILWLTVQNGEAGFREVNTATTQTQYAPGVKFKVLAIILPVLVGLTFLLFEYDSGRRELVDREGNVQKILVEWPKAHEVFNRMRLSWYRDSIFESLRAKARGVVVYDRSEIGNIIWLSLIFGGPLFFFWLSWDSDEEEAAQVTKVVQDKIKTKEAELRSLIADQAMIVKKRQKPLEDQIKMLRETVTELEGENRLLKAKMEFGAAAPTVKAVTKAQAHGSGGVLDGELL